MVMSAVVLWGSQVHAVRVTLMIVNQCHVLTMETVM